MFDGIQYFPALSTRAHEQLAYAKCSADVKDKMVPIVTLTRYGNEETLEETATILLSDLDGRAAIVDFDPVPRPTTSKEEAAERRRRKQEAKAKLGQPPSRERSEKELASDEERRRKATAFVGDIGKLTDPINGPLRWVDMMSEFPDLVPVLRHDNPRLIGPQLDIVARKGTASALRLNPRELSASVAIKENIRVIRDHLNTLMVIVDLQNIRGDYTTSLEAAKSFLAQLYEGLDNEAEKLDLVLLSNSFPTSKNSLRDMPRTLSMDEVKLFKEISGTFPVRYGDYMSVAPRRGSSKGGGNGWFPHVDLVEKTAWQICLYEDNSDEMRYIDASTDTAEGPYWSRRAPSWGTEIIETISVEKALKIQGKQFTTPTSWISVRANQHLTQMAMSR